MYVFSGRPCIEDKENDRFLGYRQNILTRTLEQEEYYCPGAYKLGAVNKQKMTMRSFKLD